MNGGVAASGAAAAIAQAIKASGTIVELEPREFEHILARQSGLVVVTAKGGFFSTKHQYLTGYKGLAFFTRSKTALDLPAGNEVIVAQRIWIPRTY